MMNQAEFLLSNGIKQHLTNKHFCLPLTKPIK
jgi:hypothetical protein